MDDGKHFSCCQNSINFQITLVKVFSLVNGFFIVVSFGDLNVEGFVKPIDFVFHGPSKGFNFRLSEPVTMHIAFSFVFGEVF